MELAPKDRGAGVGVSRTLFDNQNADECFLADTTEEYIPGVKEDGRGTGLGKPGPITKRLIGEFRALVAEEGVPIAR